MSIRAHLQSDRCSAQRHFRKYPCQGDDPFVCCDEVYGETSQLFAKDFAQLELKPGFVEHPTILPHASVPKAVREHSALAYGLIRLSFGYRG